MEDKKIKGSDVGNQKRYEDLILNMVNFYILFEREFNGLVPELEEPQMTPLLSRMLNEIHLQGRTTTKELSRRLNLSTPNTSRSVNALYRLGYIQKSASTTDKRISYITLTREGLTLFRRELQKYQEKYFSRLEHLEDKKIDELIEHFKSMKDIFMELSKY